MAFAKRSRLRKPRLRTFTVLIRLLMPSAGPWQGRVPRTPLRPRHLDRHHSVLRALDPRDVADQKGLVAPGVQIPPLAASRIVARARLAAVRTPQRACPGPVQLHPKLLRFPCWLHPGDLPLRTEAQNGIQPVFPGHVCEFLSVSLWHTCRGRTLRSVTTQSPPSPPIPKDSPPHFSPFSSSTGGLGAQPSGCAWSGREDPSSRRRHVRFLHTSPPHIATIPPRLQKPPSPPMIPLPALTTHHDR